MDQPPKHDPFVAFLKRIARRQLSQAEARRVADLLKRFLPARERGRLRREEIARHVVLGEFFGDQAAAGTSICHRPIAKTTLVNDAADLFDVSDRFVYAAHKRHRRAAEASLFVTFGPIPAEALCSGRIGSLSLLNVSA